MTTTGGMFQTGSGICGPPYKMRTNELPYWQDVPFSDKFANQYDSNSFTLSYVFAGPVATPIVLTAQPGLSDGGVEGLGGGGWTTQFTAVASAQLTPGKYWWQAILSGTPATFTGTIAGNALTISSAVTGTTIQVGQTLTGVGVTAGTIIESGAGTSWTVNNSQTVGPIAMTATLVTRIVPAEGEMIVEQDLSALTGVYDGRSIYEIGLANCETALTTFQTSGGVIKGYKIAGREMQFQTLQELIDLRNCFKGWIEAEKQAASGGDRRNIRIGFSPPSSGVPTDSSKNWPWW